MKYTKRLTFYINEQPTVFELLKYHELARERRKEYEHIERHKSLSGPAMFGSKWSSVKDINMHYACKVATAAEPETIDEFLNGETKIFKYRMEEVSSTEVLEFFAQEFLPRMRESVCYEERQKKTIIKIDEKTRNWLDPKTYKKENMQKAMSIIAKEGILTVQADFTQFYFVKEKIENGKITATLDGIKSILMRTFYDVLQESTLQLCRSGVPSKYVIPNRLRAPESVSLNERYLPMCMKNLIDNLKKNRHLKHADRKNVMNFLKNVGVPLEDALSLFRRYFGRADDKFVREYTYATRHAYGLEGSKRDYKSVLCAQIIKETGDPGCTGCPFASSANPREACHQMLMNKIANKQAPPHISPVEYYKYVSSSNIK